MTTAEANNERATVQEFRDQLTTVLNDARLAGVPSKDIIFWLRAWVAIEEKEAGKEQP